HVEVPVPVAKKGEVLVKVEAISLNPVDWKIQKGMLRPILPFRFPHIPGSDVAGEVVEVGPGVKKFSLGDKVVGMVNHFVSSIAHSLYSFWFVSLSLSRNSMYAYQCLE
ncbi:Chloroplast envelope quinone oxidoreductase homolog, partial [Linum perenne]